MEEGKHGDANVCEVIQYFSPCVQILALISYILLGPHKIYDNCAPEFGEDDYCVHLDNHIINKVRQHFNKQFENDKNIFQKHHFCLMPTDHFCFTNKSLKS